MKISTETYLAALLADLHILVPPENWVRRHHELFGKYADIELTRSLLCTKGDGVLARASALSRLEVGSVSTSGLYNLRSVFCRLNVNKGNSVPAKYYPCQPLTLTAPFPNAPGQQLPDGILTPLDQELDAVTRNPPRTAEEFFILLDTLLKKHLWSVPAGSGQGIDISLYDKMRVSAAIAVCLEQADKESEPFLLLAADFSGIQNYIFTVARTSTKGVSKRLRARSFLVDTMIQSLAYQICEEMDVPYGNILMLTGGKFYLLLPNQGSVINRLHTLRQALESDLFQRFYGEISVNLAWVTFGDAGLIDYSSTITELSRQLRAEKGRAFRSVLANENGWREDRFVLINDLTGKRGCPSCGHPLMDSSREICPDCQQQEELGGKLVVADCLWFSRDGGEFQLWDHCFLSFSQSSALGSLIRVEQLNSWEIPSNMTHLPLGVRLMANNLPKGADGEPLTFSDIAECSSGSKRMAVMKADVDNLGYLFADGMREGDRHYGTISRVSTLSRLLEMFFSGYIGHLLKTEYSAVYSVFSGGDDLFLIGPWDVMPRMARRIQQDFDAFSGQNPCVTLSAALYTAGPKTNIALLAEQSERELKRVKNSAPQVIYPEKQGRNGVSFLGDIFSWEDFAAQLDHIEALRPAVSSVNISILRRIAQYSDMYRKFLHDHDVLGLMFEPLLHYDQVRNYEDLPPFFLKYTRELQKNAADYRNVNRDLYFARTVVACILNQTKEARGNGV